MIPLDHVGGDSAVGQRRLFRQKVTYQDRVSLRSALLFLNVFPGRSGVFCRGCRIVQL